MLFRSPQSAIINQGKPGNFFDVGRACRQGDPIAPYLFILAMNPLIRRIEEEVKGFKEDRIQLKTGAYADDLYVAFQDEDDLRKCLELLDKFQEASGLKPNRDKCQLLLEGQWTNLDTSGIPVCNTICITGIEVGPSRNHEELEAKNIGSRIQTIRKLTTDWSRRDLSLRGRVLLAKSHLLSQFEYLSRTTAISPSRVKEIKKIIYRFIWKGPDKIPRQHAAKPWNEGGINFQDPGRIFAGPAIDTLKRLQAHLTEEDIKEPWLIQIWESIKSKGGVRALHRRAVDNETAGPTRDFWQNITSITEAPLEAQALRGNKNIIKAGQDTEELLEFGIVRPIDIMDQQGHIRSKNEAIRDGLPRRLGTLWARLSRRALQLQSQGRLIATPGTEKIKKQGSQDKWNELTNLEIYVHGINKNLGETTRKKVVKCCGEGPVPESMSILRQMLGIEQAEGTKYIENILKLTSESKKKSFATLFLHKKTYTNKNYHTFGVKQSAECSFCHHSPQTWVHLYLECPEVLAFREWIAAAKWGLSKSLTNRELILGPNDRALAMLTLEMNYFIHRSNYWENDLSYEAFAAQVRNVEAVARATSSDSTKHAAKWRRVLDAL